MADSLHDELRALVEEMRDDVAVGPSDVSTYWHGRLSAILDRHPPEGYALVPVDSGAPARMADALHSIREHVSAIGDKTPVAWKSGRTKRGRIPMSNELPPEAVAALKERVDDFNALRLPGQMPMMHMGTSYLVNDLWRTVREQAAALEAVRAQALKCVEVEPELPDVMPDEMWEAIRNSRREDVEEILRVTVRATKNAVRSRIDAALSGAEGGRE